MFVGFHGRCLDFFVGARQKLFCLGSVATHVEFVRLLGCIDSADCLIDQPLCGGQVGMPMRVHVLGNSNPTRNKRERQSCAEG